MTIMIYPSDIQMVNGSEQFPLWKLVPHLGVMGTIKTLYTRDYSAGYDVTSEFFAKALAEKVQSFIDEENASLFASAMNIRTRDDASEVKDKADEMTGTVPEFISYYARHASATTGSKNCGPMCDILFAMCEQRGEDFEEWAIALLIDLVK